MWLTCKLKTSWVHLLSQIYPTNRNLAFNFQCWNTRRKWLKNYKVFLYFGLIISTVLLGATSFPLTISAWKSCQDPGFVVNVGGCLNSLNSPIFQYCLPQPFFAPSTRSKHLHPSFPNHWCGSCTCVAFSEIATAFLMASMVWHLCFLVFPVLAKTVGDQKVPDSALLALPLLLLCCPHPTSLISVFQSMSAPPCSLVSTFLALPCYSTLWNDTQKVHILSMLNRMKALCFNPHISNIFKTVLCGPPTSESSGSKLTKQIPVSYL